MNLSPIIAAVEARRQTQNRVILAMDGMSAAGKTTAAEVLAPRWNAPIVHMDDFFLPPALRTPERLAEPGGNVHYERFQSEVLPSLKAGQTFSYRVFDCSAMDYGGIRAIPTAPVVIVEGAYAMHPIFEKYWDLAVFFSIDPESQRSRILRRGGEEAWRNFESRWIPMENRYHTAYNTSARADICIKTEAPDL